MHTDQLAQAEAALAEASETRPATSLIAEAFRLLDDELYLIQGRLDGLKEGASGRQDEAMLLEQLENICVRKRQVLETLLADKESRVPVTNGSTGEGVVDHSQRAA